MLRIFVGLGFGGSGMAKLIHGLFCNGVPFGQACESDVDAPGEVAGRMFGTGGQVWLGWVGVMPIVDRR